jgi:hypothetical protein
MKKILLSLVLILFFQYACIETASAQFNTAAIENRIRPDSLETGELHLNLYNFNYVRNYEYFGKFQDGYTLYGTQLEPQLVYYAHPNLAILAGAYIRKDFGSNGVYEAKPLFSLKYQKQDLSLIFGSLEGNIQHRYIEPLYDFERKISTPIEYGTQLLIEKEKFFLDGWIAWQKMIYPSATEKEQIVGGLSTETVLSDKNGWKLSIPVQLMAYHQGGQIDLLKDQPLTTLANVALGFKFHKGYSQPFLKELFTDNYLAGFKDFSPTKQLAYQQGYGLWLHVGATTRAGTLMLSYWGGNKFISIKGMPLYQSVSNTVYNTGYTENKRNILMLRYAYQKELLPHLYLDVRLEPHLDLGSAGSKKVEFSNSFFITYKENIRLFKVK